MNQTYIALLKDKDGKQLDFQRYGYKRIATVKKNILALLNNSLYRALTPGIATIEIYQTCYDHHGLTPAAVINL